MGDPACDVCLVIRGIMGMVLARIWKQVVLKKVSYNS